MNSPLPHRLLAACTLLAAALAAGAALTLLQPAPDKVLIVHSYNTDLPWVGDVDHGMDGALRQARPRVQVRRHYMNLLNHPDCHHFRDAAEDVRLAIDDWHPRVLVLVDDLAQALVGSRHVLGQADAGSKGTPQEPSAQPALARCERNGAPLFKAEASAAANAPMAIFYAGVNAGVAQYGYDRASNVTGVLEHKNLAALAAVLKKVNDAAATPAVAVQLLSDHSATALAENERYGSPHWAPLRWLAPANVASFREWQQRVRSASRQGAMLLIANYQNLLDDQGRIVPAEEVIAWTERHSEYPAVGAGTGFVSDGGLVTVAMSGIEQGETVMRMALHYLRTGELPPPQSATRILVGLNRALARKHHLETAPLYRALQARLGGFMAVSEHVYLESGPQGGMP
jgi:hypothetical protein